MRIVDREGRELEEGDADLARGYLVPDTVVVAHHEAREFREEEGHLEYAAFWFADGARYEVAGAGDPNVGPEGWAGGDWEGRGEPTGADQVWVVDVPEVPWRDAWDETEDVLRYIAYTEKELAERAAAERAAREAESVAAYARMMAPALPDARALECRWLFPDWSGEGVAYGKGDRAVFGEGLWRCVQAHTSQEGWEPPDTPGLWAEVLPGQSGEVGEWVQPESTNPYMKGDRVTWKGKTWESLVDGNVWEPGAQGTEALWREVPGEGE